MTPSPTGGGPGAPRGTLPGPPPLCGGVTRRHARWPLPLCGGVVRAPSGAGRGQAAVVARRDISRSDRSLLSRPGSSWSLPPLLSRCGELTAPRMSLWEALRPENDLFSVSLAVTINDVVRHGTYVFLAHSWLFRTAWPFLRQEGAFETLSPLIFAHLP